MFKLIFFVPGAYREKVKEALFSAGAGVLGQYRRCSWECEGSGQFEPMDGSDPFQGKTGHLEKVKEFRVEILVPEDDISACLKALKKSHPYEAPAYEYFRVYREEPPV